MLACKHCSTPNSLDSTFCKKCGTAVPTDQKREATLQLDKLVDEGLVALNAGRSAEALAIADAAIATDPTHLGALQLKSAVHERRGEIADALESAERIVELNPEGELDRIKRNGLRTSLLNASTPVAPDRRVAFAAAAAAMVLVACAGVLIARRPWVATPTTQQVASNLGTGGDPIVDPSVVVLPTQANNVAQPSPQAATPSPAPSTSGLIGGVNPNDLPRYDPGITRPLPAPTGNGGTMRVEPINPGGPPTTLPPVTNPSTPQPPAGRKRDPDPTDLPPATEAKEDTGEIEISVSRTGGPRAGGGRMIETGTNGAAAYARVGTERYGLGDYAGAAANLEKAVQGGGDAVGLNLRLGQAYSRLGRNSEAATAYERSRAAAAAALKNGKGNKELLQEQHDTAAAGLKTVKANAVRVETSARFGSLFLEEKASRPFGRAFRVVSSAREQARGTKAGASSRTPKGRPSSSEREAIS